MGSRQKIASGLFWTVVYNIINAAYGFFSVPMLLDHYGKNEYGLIGLALSINVYMQLMDLGFNSTNIRFFAVWFSSKQYDKLRRAFQSSLAFYGIIGVFNVLALLLVTLFSDKIFDVTPEQNHVLVNLLVILMISALVNWYSSCFDQMIKATENVAWVQRRSIIPKLIQVLLLFLVVWCNLTITVYFALTSFAFFSILPMSVNKIRREVRNISFRPKWDTGIMREILPYCLGIFSFSIFQFSFYNLRPVFLGIQGTLSSISDYRIMNGIIGMVSLFGSMFLNVLLPSTSKIVSKEDTKAYYTVAYDGTKYITIVISFCCFGVMAIGPSLLMLYVGKEYLYLLPWLNIWLCCTLATHNQAISSLILAGSKVKAIAYNSAAASIVGLVSAWFLIPLYEIGGVVYSFVIYLSIQLIFYYFYYWPEKMKINSWKVFSCSFLPAVTVGIVSSFSTKLMKFDMTPWVLFCINGTIFTFIYFILTYTLVLNRRDKNFFRKLLKRGA